MNRKESYVPRIHKGREQTITIYIKFCSNVFNCYQLLECLFKHWVTCTFQFLSEIPNHIVISSSSACVSLNIVRSTKLHIILFCYIGSVRSICNICKLNIIVVCDGDNLGKHPFTTHPQLLLSDRSEAGVLVRLSFVGHVWF